MQRTYPSNRENDEFVLGQLDQIKLIDEKERLPHILACLPYLTNGIYAAYLVETLPTTNQLDFILQYLARLPIDFKFMLEALHNEADKTQFSHLCLEKGWVNDSKGLKLALATFPANTRYAEAVKHYKPDLDIHEVLSILDDSEQFDFIETFKSTLNHYNFVKVTQAFSENSRGRFILKYIPLLEVRYDFWEYARESVGHMPSHERLAMVGELQKITKKTCNLEYMIKILLPDDKLPFLLALNLKIHRLSTLNALLPYLPPKNRFEYTVLYPHVIETISDCFSVCREFSSPIDIGNFARMHASRLIYAGTKTFLKDAESLKKHASKFSNERIIFLDIFLHEAMIRLNYFIALTQQEKAIITSVTELFSHARQDQLLAATALKNLLENKDLDINQKILEVPALQSKHPTLAKGKLGEIFQIIFLFASIKKEAIEFNSKPVDQRPAICCVM